jgi:2-polyprenyl-3-methyl-5-hydroxy-6-metoxy-1,4-benzoquinol methylase
LRETLKNIEFENCLEIGCGTGKNTEWLALKSAEVTAVDLSEEMLAVAKQKIKSGNVEFQNSDITEAWTFKEKQFDLITFSLVLEHIENLKDIFKKASKSNNFQCLCIYWRIASFQAILRKQSEV